MAIICCHCINSIQTATKKKESKKKDVHNGDNKKKTHLIEKLTVCSGVNMCPTVIKTWSISIAVVY